MKAQNKRYSGIDLGGFLLSILIIMIHCGAIDYEPNAVYKHWGILIRNVSVAFFFCANGFLGLSQLDLQSNTDDLRRWKISCFKNMKLYVSWFIVYLPLMIYGEFVVYQSDFVKGILKIVRAAGITGWHFYSWHLWYMLAMVISVAVLGFLMKKGCKIQNIFLLAVMCFCIGEFLNDAVKVPGHSVMVDWYFNLFETTRNWIFAGSVFVAYGVLSGKSKRLQKLNTGWISGILVMFLICFAFLNSYILINSLCTIGICCMIFEGLKIMKLPECKVWKVFREMGKVFYFVHMLYIALYDLVFRSYISLTKSGLLIGVLACCFMTYFLVEALIRNGKGRLLSELFKINTQK